MTASYEVRGAIAVVTLNNPPVNGLGYDTRRGIADGIDKANADAGRQGHRHHRGRQGLFGRRRHPRVRLAEGDCRAQPAVAVAAVRGLGQADRGRDAQRVHGRRAGTGAGLPLPRGRARHAGGAARGQARPGARCRRHAAPAARAGRRNCAEHDRQRRAGEERVAGFDAGTEAVRQADRRRPACRRAGLCRGSRRQAPAAAGAQSEGHACQCRRLLRLRAQHRQGDGEELPGTGQVRRLRRSRREACVSTTACVSNATPSWR